jgi:hypothetical protein
MQVTHLYTNEKGESAFADLEIQFERDGVEQFANLSAPTAMLLNVTEAGHSYPWHNAPQRQWVVTLQGKIKVSLRNGQSRRFGAGSIILADDLTGSGHATSVVSSQPWQCIYLPFSGAPRV